MSLEPAIRIRNLRRGFRHMEAGFTLHVPELHILPSRMVVFRGPSGCGKSTLFDTLGLIARPDAADEFSINDGSMPMDVLSATDSRLTWMRGHMIGYVLQNAGLIPSLSAYENIAMPCRLFGDKPDKLRLDRLVERLGIAEQMKKKPAKLSGGQQQRVAIARALINRPSLVLADEPTGQLDEFSAAEVRDLLANIVKDEGVTLLIVTHDPELFAKHMDHSYGFQMARVNGHLHSTLIALQERGLKA